jgi:hypothetical protein
MALVAHRALLVATQLSRIPFGKALLLRYDTGGVFRRDTGEEVLIVKRTAFKQALGGVR